LRLDDDSIFDEDSVITPANFVKCEEHVGFMENEYAQAVKKLNGDE
jgi:hypothetical protein